MEKNLTEAQVKTILQNAPKGTDPNKIVEGLVSRGYILQGLNDQPVEQTQATPQTSLGSKAKALVGGTAKGFGTDLALGAIDFVGKKVVENNPFSSEETKQKQLANLEKAGPLTKQFEKVTEQDVNPGIAKTGEVIGTVASLPVIASELAATKVGQKVVAKIAEKKATKNIENVVEKINPTSEVLTPLQRKQAIQEGRQTIKTTKLGGEQVSYIPTAETTRAAEILSDTVKASDKPNIVFAKVKSKIAERGSQAEKYLADNPTKITNAEDANVFSAVKAQAEKSLTDSELKAYDEQIKLFQKQLLGRKGGYTTENYYKALKDWEQNIAEHLPRGQEALLDPTGVASAKIHAASDIRKAVRDLIASKHPDFKDQMYDLASLFEAKGNALQVAAKQKSKSVLEKNPKLKTALQIGGVGATIGGGINLLGE